YRLRALGKRFGPKGRIAGDKDEGDVYTRFDSPSQVRRLVPQGCHIVASRGIRIATPTAHVMRAKLGRALFGSAERFLCDSPLRIFGGFYIVAMEKRD